MVIFDVTVENCDATTLEQCVNDVIVGTKNNKYHPAIQGPPDLNAQNLSNCIGHQIKKNSVKIVGKFAIFTCKFFFNILEFFNINVCLKVNSFSYNNSILHNFFNQ